MIYGEQEESGDVLCDYVRPSSSFRNRGSYAPPTTPRVHAFPAVPRTDPAVLNPPVKGIGTEIRKTRHNPYRGGFVSFDLRFTYLKEGGPTSPSPGPGMYETRHLTGGALVKRPNTASPCFCRPGGRLDIGNTGTWHQETPLASAETRGTVRSNVQALPQHYSQSFRSKSDRLVVNKPKATTNATIGPGCYDLSKDGKSMGVATERRVGRGNGREGSSSSVTNPFLTDWRAYMKITGGESSRSRCGGGGGGRGDGHAVGGAGVHGGRVGDGPYRRNVSSSTPQRWSHPRCTHQSPIPRKAEYSLMQKKSPSAERNAPSDRGRTAFFNEMSHQRMKNHPHQQEQQQRQPQQRQGEKSGANRNQHGRSGPHNNSISMPEQRHPSPEHSNTVRRPHQRRQGASVSAENEEDRQQHEQRRQEQPGPPTPGSRRFNSGNTPLLHTRNGCSSDNCDREDGRSRPASCSPPSRHARQRRQQREEVNDVGCGGTVVPSTRDGGSVATRSVGQPRQFVPRPPSVKISSSSGRPRTAGSARTEGSGNHGAPSRRSTVPWCDNDGDCSEGSRPFQVSSRPDQAQETTIGGNRQGGINAEAAATTATHVSGDIRTVGSGVFDREDHSEEVGGRNKATVGSEARNVVVHGSSSRTFDNEDEQSPSHRRHLSDDVADIRRACANDTVISAVATALLSVVSNTF